MVPGNDTKICQASFNFPTPQNLPLFSLLVSYLGYDTIWVSISKPSVTYIYRIEVRPIILLIGLNLRLNIMHLLMRGS